jgi:hypothetical protein
MEIQVAVVAVNYPVSDEKVSDEKDEGVEDLLVWSWFSFPTSLSGLCRYLGALTGTEFSGSGFAALQSTQAPQTNGSWVLRYLCRRIELGRLPRGFKHNLVGKLVRIARTGLL